MDHQLLTKIVFDLVLILIGGFIVGMICKRFSFSMIAGYFFVGIAIGHGGLGLITQESHELEMIAEAGALLLLFSVGIEFSLKELIKLSRFFFIGGLTQMTLVAIPLTIVCMSLGMNRNTALLAALAATLSSTVLVFKSLAEWGQSSTPHGRRGIGILLFQDVALVPLMLIFPLLADPNQDLQIKVFLKLFAQAGFFILMVVLIHWITLKVFVPMIQKMRSVELLVLFTLSILLGTCYGSYLLELPPAIGALAAGLILSGNKLSRQVDTIILPFREFFASVFFVSLGLLLNPKVFLSEPLLLTLGLLGMLILKSGAAALALKFTGLNWRSSIGMGIGLSQLGEFSFILIATGLTTGAIDNLDYNRMLFIALGSLILTPPLIKAGLKWMGALPELKAPSSIDSFADIAINRALIVGTSPFGRQAATGLETMGLEIALIDLSSINLHDFAVQGFQTYSGDARDKDVLLRAELDKRNLVILSITDDDAALQIMKSIREVNEKVSVIVQCQYYSNVQLFIDAGATEVLSQEKEALKDIKQAFSSLLREGKMVR